MEKMFEIVARFDVPGTVEEIRPLGPGFINDTLIVKCNDEGETRRYILQRKNHIIFPDVPGMMDNIQAVTTHIKSKVSDPMRETLTVI